MTKITPELRSRYAFCDVRAKIVHLQGKQSVI
nr:MAG TPA: hypothetical protein [Caudoviricetes sp.]